MADTWAVRLILRYLAYEKASAIADKQTGIFSLQI